jgi:hypothetical protein
MLHVVGIRFFEPRSGAARLLQGLGRNLLRGLPGDLLWRRLSPWRAAMMPVRVLEGLKPAQVRQRKQLLSSGGIDFCVFITIWGYIIEVILLAGEIFFLYMIIELMQENYITSVWDFLGEQQLFYFIAGSINYILVESLYVCMGFGLYINSRVEVEGWDLEVLFRAFLKNSPSPANRNSEKRMPRRKAAGIFVFCLSLFLLAPANGYAETAEAPGPAFEILEDILTSEDFGGEKDGWGIRFRNQKEPKPMPEFNIAPWVDTIKTIFAASLRIVLVLAILALIVVSVAYVFRLKSRGAGPFKKRINAESIPANSGSGSPEQLLERARSLYARQPREAWAACFAAALAALLTYRRLSFPVDATEYGCLALVRDAARAQPDNAVPAAGAVPSVSAAEAAGFGEFVLAWVAFAYGGKTPAGGAFDKALAFCESLGARNG